MAQYNKFWVAAIMGILGLLGAYGIVPEGWVSEETVATVVGLLTPVLVWSVPNRL